MVLRSENLVKFYGKRKVVDQLSIEVENGKIIGLLGPNGAGKTTTFYMMVGVVQVSSGRIFLDQNDITNLPMYRRARLGIGYLPQESSIFRQLTVYENVYSILEMLYKDKEKNKKRTFELLEKFKVSHLKDLPAYKLSGGERRRVEIARALTSNPKFLLLDEPFTGIDPKVKEDIQNMVKELAREGIGILITDHNVRETLEIVDVAHIIYEGKILLSGDAHQLINDDKARQLYLGERFRL
ncbi:MAG: LPS export ABC transporter ATP-binding protein [bacterium]|uniref:ABC transporter related protein n=2 Tax=Bacteria candidate phyla TaxID=1783234 RepID=A0A101I3S2_UNCT6|nr:MAG: ABC transporter related protein [candidate division TA06 bacterium 32_111]KUK88133.1 MAG: ABC transporter related protein [candidate division TA06 bacterium 34_109]MDI6700934.1 LPS export ABC transporter ATP-binding protein [bacterium]HAF07063.1 LPS export ABC transporter ATP-binding protein [candidate division WOR-3 bacterium]HCP16978.1 LPS export ABC transporter ATP-binding protein [candidate division WOR-3 bacterium]